MLPVQQQVNCFDCGVHAIANAIEFLVEDGNPTTQYDIAIMRQHLVECLERKEFSPFPKSAKKARRRKANVIEIIISVHET